MTQKPPPRLYDTLRQKKPPSTRDSAEWTIPHPSNRFWPNSASKSEYMKEALWRVDDLDEKTGRTALIDAVIKGDKEAVEVILTANPDINLRDSNKMTPLLWAVKLRHIDIAKFLVGAGADVNIVDVSGNTPLHSCFLGAMTPVVETLLETLLNYENIIIDKQNTSGNTPLALGTFDKTHLWKNVYRRLCFYSLSLATHEGAVSAVRLLLGRGATPNIQNKNGSTPLLIACKLGLVVS